MWICRWLWSYKFVEESNLVFQILFVEECVCKKVSHDKCTKLYLTSYVCFLQSRCNLRFRSTKWCISHTNPQILSPAPFSSISDAITAATRRSRLPSPSAEAATALWSCGLHYSHTSSTRWRYLFQMKVLPFITITVASIEQKRVEPSVFRSASYHAGNRVQITWAKHEYSASHGVTAHF